MDDLSALSAEHLRFIAHERAGEVIKLRAHVEALEGLIMRSAPVSWSRPTMLDQAKAWEVEAAALLESDSGHSIHRGDSDA